MLVNPSLVSTTPHIVDPKIILAYIIVTPSTFLTTPPKYESVTSKTKVNMVMSQTLQNQLPIFKRNTLSRLCTFQCKITKRLIDATINYGELNIANSFKLGLNQR